MFGAVYARTTRCLRNLSRGVHQRPGPFVAAPTFTVDMFGCFEWAGTLIDDLYSDAQIYQVLALHGVVIPDEWSATGPFESLAPFPLSKKLVKALYDMVGLPIFHIALLLGVGQGAVRSALIAAGVMFRAAGEPAPWTARRFSD